MNEIENIEQFDKYLHGQLSNEDKRWFEERVENDSGFRASFEKYKAITQGIVDNAMKEKLNSFDKEIPEPNLFFMQLRKPFSIAAVIIALFTVGYFAFWERNTIDNKELFADNFSPIENEIIEFTRGDSVPKEYEHLTKKEFRAFYLGMRAYMQKNYLESDSLFMMVDPKSVTADMALYFGVTQLALSKDEIAISSFKKALKSENKSFVEHTQWYIALTYLKIENNKEAIYWLQKLKESNLYSKKVKTILKRIE